MEPQLMVIGVAVARIFLGGVEKYVPPPLLE